MINSGTIGASYVGNSLYYLCQAVVRLLPDFDMSLAFICCHSV